MVLRHRRQKLLRHAEAAVEVIEASAEALAPAEDAIPASQPRDRKSVV